MRPNHRFSFFSVSILVVGNGSKTPNLQMLGPYELLPWRLLMFP